MPQTDTHDSPSDKKPLVFISYSDHEVELAGALHSLLNDWRVPTFFWAQEEGSRTQRNAN
jgi:hypothetical protein